MDSSGEVLYRIQSLSRDIFDLTMNCRFGALSLKDENVQPVPDFLLGNLPPTQRELLELNKHKIWLNNQVRAAEIGMEALKADIDFQKSSNRDMEEEEDMEVFLNESIVHLQTELFQKSSASSLNTLLLKRLRLNDALTRELFEDGNDLLKEHIRHRDMLAVTFLKELEALNAIKAEISSVKKSSVALKTENRNLMFDIETSKLSAEARAESMSSSNNTEDSLRNQKIANMHSSKNKILKNVFTNLILESGVNWYEDKELKKIMLDLGKIET
eukprot:Nk52_evm35s248 gene=Nk52_evmTU35s248